ncbi:MAG TPA: DUF2141 domain-containing protein [Pontiella sp.]|nr:DUF2141 domain-containing protein [Pontiella sp.]
MAGWIAATVCAETLTVNVTTKGPREGVIAILVFKDEKGFPNQDDLALRKARIPVTAEEPVECVITNLPYGTYSVSVLHDINDNYKADKMLGFGPPREPVGFSNLDKKVRRMPKFETTLFTFNAENTEIQVPVFYVF